MIRLVVWLVVLTGCRQIFGIDDTRVLDASDDAVDAPNGDASPSERRKVIKIDATRVTEAIPGFPLWVALHDAEIAVRARADGSDIHFTLPDGTPLPFERQRWDSQTGEIQAWVRVDLDPMIETQVDVRYGSTAVYDADPPAVFGADFAAVWHLEDRLDTPMLDIADARGTRPGTASGGLGPLAHVDAMLGSGIDFDGVDDQIGFANPLAGTMPHTISAWVNERLSTNYDSIVTVGNAADNRSRWFHARFTGDKVAVGMFNNDWITGETVMGTGWVLLHWVFEGASRVSRLYRNGVLVGTHTHLAGIDTAGSAGYIGYAPPAWGFPDGCGFNGTLDEVRIATVAHSAAFIAAEYANQAAPDTFYTVSAELLVP